MEFCQEKYEFIKTNKIIYRISFIDSVLRMETNLYFELKPEVVVSMVTR